MATVTRTFMVDDIDGSRDDVDTVQIALDNASYEIDLSAANAERLREKLARFVENGKKVTTHPKGRKVTRGRAAAPAPVGREQAQSVRDWARNMAIRCPREGAFPRVCRRRSTARTECGYRWSRSPRPVHTVAAVGTRTVEARQECFRARTLLASWELRMFIRTGVKNWLNTDHIAEITWYPEETNSSSNGRPG